MKIKSNTILKTVRRALASAVVLASAAAMMSCSDGDDTKKDNNSPLANATDVEIPAGSTGFVSDQSYDRRANGPRRLNLIDYDFYWTSGDKLYLYDNEQGKYVGSDEEKIGGGNQRSALFIFKKQYTATTYDVFCVGKQTSLINGKALGQAKIVINNSQEQTTAGDPAHIFADGDCSHAVATRGDDGRYRFTLQHDAAYLKIYPYSTDAALQKCVLSRVVITATDDDGNPVNIAGTYTFDNNGLAATADGSTGKNQIVVECKNKNNYAEGFNIQDSQDAAIENTGMYVVMHPGNGGNINLSIDYCFKDPNSSNYDKAVVNRKVSGSFNAGTLTQIRHKLSIMHFRQSIGVANYEPLAAFGASDYGGSALGGSAESGGDTSSELYYKRTNSPLFATLPTFCALTWYLSETSYWDTTSGSLPGVGGFQKMTYWYNDIDGRFYSGGLWLKKSSKITGFSTTEEHPSIVADQRSGYEGYYNDAAATVTGSRPENTDDYFFLPAFANVNNSTNYAYSYSAGRKCNYWSCNRAYKADNSWHLNAYHMEYPYTGNNSQLQLKLDRPVIHRNAVQIVLVAGSRPDGTPWFQ